VEVEVMRNALILGGVAVVVYFVLTRKASASEPVKAAGFGLPPFQTTGPTGNVVGCSFARAGGILVDANTGKEISEADAARRAAAEGCTVPPKPTKATKPGQGTATSLYVGGK
jgi:hypothetical protein